MSSVKNDSIITIIIPVYNAENWIADCINSILIQTVSYWKLLLVDDGSVDNSGTICDEYAKNYSRINVVHQKNGGPGKARNVGIETCDTPWFTFVDADDKLMPTYLENFHVENCLDMRTLSCQGFKRVNMKGENLGEQYDFIDSIYTGKDFLKKAFEENDLYSYGQSVGKLYNKFICDKYDIRLNTDIYWCEDHLFYLQYLLHVKEIQLHSGCLYLYQFCEGQTTLTHRILPYKEALNIFHNMYDAANAIVQKYTLENSVVMKKINYHSITAGFSLVINSLYKEENDFQKRMLILAILHSDMKKMYKRYNPNKFKGKIIGLMFLYLPLPILDIILKYFIRR